jgi:hypothetical protein
MYGPLPVPKVYTLREQEEAAHIEGLLAQSRAIAHDLTWGTTTAEDPHPFEGLRQTLAGDYYYSQPPLVDDRPWWRVMLDRLTGKGY